MDQVLDEFNKLKINWPLSKLQMQIGVRIYLRSLLLLLKLI